MASINTESDDYHPIVILIDELKNEDIQLRLNSIKKLQSIAKALGPERTRTELIPYLQDSVLEDEDEVLVVLSEELGNLIEFVGGAEHAVCLLPPLQILAGAEELVVREKAVESLCKIAKEIPTSSFEESFLPLLFSLSKADWFTSRTSACGLFTVSYPRANAEMKKSLRKTFGGLCHDDTPMVKRAAATNLGSFAKQIEKESVKSEILPLFQSLSTDEQDSVRLLGVENCALLGSMLTNEENIQFILPTIKASSLDKSWRVRYMVARLLKELCESMGTEITKTELIGAFVKLLKDTEAEVRTEASLRIADVCSLLTKEMNIKTILPCVKDLVSDSSQHVRAALAQVIMSLAPIYGKVNSENQPNLEIDWCITEDVVPIGEQPVIVWEDSEVDLDSQNIEWDDFSMDTIEMVDGSSITTTIELVESGGDVGNDNSKSDNNNFKSIPNIEIEEKDKQQEQEQKQEQKQQDRFDEPINPNETILEFRPLRNQFLDELFELEIFLNNRCFEMEKSNSMFGIDQLNDESTDISTSQCKEYLKSISDILIKLSNTRVRQILEIKSSKKFVDRLVLQFTQKQQNIAKYTQLIIESDQKIEDLNLTLGQSRNKIDQFNKETKILKSNLEQSISNSLFDKKKINIMIPFSLN